MLAVTNLNNYTHPGDGMIVTVGNFDGIHLGHQAIFRQCSELSQRYELPWAVVTFQPAPVRILRPQQAPRLLTPFPLKQKLLAEIAPDVLVVIKPTAEFLAMSPEAFAREVLLKRLKTRHLVEGHTFGFGARRAGTMVSAEALGKELGFQSHLARSFTVSLDAEAPTAVSSTVVRHDVMAGAMDRVAACLGRPYRLVGTVVKGRGQGRTLGFPTANLELLCSEQLVPEDGVYAAWARVGETVDQAWQSGQRFPAAVSIGRCETFEDGHWQIEAFLMGELHRESSDGQELVDGEVSSAASVSPDSFASTGEAPPEDLYEKTLMLDMVAHIRAQQRFDTPEALIEAIRGDYRAIKDRLSADHWRS